MCKVETARLILRPFVESDLDALATICADAAVMRYIGDGRPNTREQTARGLDGIIKHWQRHDFGLWAAVAKDSNDMAGFAGLKYLDNTEEVEVGYRLARKYWGMGLATEASKASIRFGFDELKLSRIVAVVQHGNAASQRVLEKSGLRFERNAHYYNTSVRYYTLAKTDFVADDSLYLVS